MEGKTAACAHLSPLGNVAAACADLWSNESVQNIKLLGGMAPTVCLEQLEYDVRLFNQAVHQGRDTVLTLQHLLVESDIHYDPQALVLSPEHVISISEEIVRGKSYLEAAIRGSLKGLDIIEQSINEGSLQIADIEKPWIDKLRDEIASMPRQEEEFIDKVLPFIDDSNGSLLNMGYRKVIKAFYDHKSGRFPDDIKMDLYSEEIMAL